MSKRSTELCEYCGDRAVAFQHGTRVCGRCGTRRSLGENPVILPRRSRRTAIVSILSSGLLFKLMMGSVALAAVTGLAAVSVLPSRNAPPRPSDSTVSDAVTTVTVQPNSEDGLDATFTEGELDDLVTQARGQAERAGELAVAAREWADCVSDFAQEHLGEPLDPHEICGERPRPSEFGLGNENGNRGRGADDPAGQSDDKSRGNSADALGQDTTDPTADDEGGPDKVKEKDKDEGTDKDAAEQEELEQEEIEKEVEDD